MAENKPHPKPWLFKKGNKHGKGRVSVSQVLRTRVAQQLKRRVGEGRTRKQSPLEFLVWVLNNPDVRMNLRVDAAKAAAPYLHRRMPVQVEGGDPNKPILLAPQLVQSMSKEDLLALHQLLSRTALPTLAKPVIEAVAIQEDADATEDTAPADQT